MASAISVCIIRPQTSFEEVTELAKLSDPTNPDHFRWEMEQYYPNSLSSNPSLNTGILYGLYDRHELLAVARIKQDDYSFDVASIEYVAVKADRRREKLGTRLMKGLFEEISTRWEKNCAMLATVDRADFYFSIGMKVWGVYRPKDGSPRYHLYMPLT